MSAHVPEISSDRRESVPSILETEAAGEIADIYADIRRTLRTSVVNLIWRNLATMPGALRWTWSAVRPLYLGPASGHADAVRRTLALPDIPELSVNELLAAGVDATALTGIRGVLDSYYHTNALALVVLSALLALDDTARVEDVLPVQVVRDAAPIELPALPPMAALEPGVRRLIGELNAFGEDGDPYLIASMYRHLAYWPGYLTLVRAMLAPLQADGSLNALTRSARALGRAHGLPLSRRLAPAQPPESVATALAACRLFVEHPIARMTGICAIIRRATPEQAPAAVE
jgi:hypothetical protein